MLNVVISVIINTALLVIWLSLFYLCNRRKKIILLGLVFSYLSFVLSLTVYYFINVTNIPLTEAQHKGLVAPIVEESSKLLVTAFAFRFAHDRLSPGVKLFGASLGSGFAYWENFGHVTNPLTVLFRGGLPWTMHIVTATLTAWGLWRALKYKYKSRWLFTPLLSMLIHGAFNLTVLAFGFH